MLVAVAVRTGYQRSLPHFTEAEREEWKGSSALTKKTTEIATQRVKALDGVFDRLRSASQRPGGPCDAAKPLTANQITSELLIGIPRRFPHIRVWRSNRIDAMAVGRGGKLRRVSAGIDGQGDITGMASVVIDGKRIAIRCELEVKATYSKGHDRVRPSQAAFGAMVLEMGGLYLVVRDVDEGLDDIGRFLCRFTEDNL